MTKRALSDLFLSEVRLLFSEVSCDGMRHDVVVWGFFLRASRRRGAAARLESRSATRPLAVRPRHPSIKMWRHRRRPWRENVDYGIWCCEAPAVRQPQRKRRGFSVSRTEGGVVSVPVSVKETWPLGLN